jgi:hypothetical protein
LYYLNPLSKLKFNEFVGTSMSMLSYSFINWTHSITYYAYPNFWDKNIKLHSNVSTKFVILAILLFFINASEDLVMANDATKFSNPSISPLQDEKFECFLIVSRRRIDWKGGAHLSCSIHMGLLSVCFTFVLLSFI